MPLILPNDSNKRIDWIFTYSTDEDRRVSNNIKSEKQYFGVLNNILFRTPLLFIILDYIIIFYPNLLRSLLSKKSNLTTRRL